MNDQYRAITQLKNNVLSKLSKSIDIRKNQGNKYRELALNMLQVSGADSNPNNLSQSHSNKNHKNEGARNQHSRSRNALAGHSQPISHDAKNIKSSQNSVNISLGHGNNLENQFPEVVRQASCRSQSVKNGGNISASVNCIRHRLITNQGYQEKALPELDRCGQNTSLECIKCDSSGNSSQRQKRQNRLLEQYTVDPQNYYRNNMREVLSGKENKMEQQQIEKKLLQYGSKEIDLRARLRRNSQRKNTLKVTEDFVKKNRPVLATIADSNVRINQSVNYGLALKKREDTLNASS